MNRSVYVFSRGSSCSSIWIVCDLGCADLLPYLRFTFQILVVVDLVPHVLVVVFVVDKIRCCLPPVSDLIVDPCSFLSLCSFFLSR